MVRIKRRHDFGKPTDQLFLVLACGYHLTDQRIEQLNQFLDEKQADKVDLPLLLMTLTHLKELELANEQENDADEYLDAFVALGGQPDKEGNVSKENLIEIIKAEFELTIDMEDFLRKIGGNSEEINYYQFCVLLDAGTGGNPSRVSSYLSQNKGSSFMRFSYFVNNMDKL
jgi:calmodulin